MVLFCNFIKDCCLPDGGFFLLVYILILSLYFPTKEKKLKTFTILKLIKAINKSDGPHIQIQITKRKKKKSFKLD
jgi:hypothetical protein